MSRTFAIGVSFGRSRSGAWGHAVALARELGDYSYDASTDTHRTIVVTNIGSAEWEKVAELVRTVRGWRHAQITVDGEVHDGARIARLLDVSSCARERDTSPLGDEHCYRMPGWALDGHWTFGCRYLSGPARQPIGTGAEDRTWFSVGRQESRSLWAVDRERIYTLVRADTGASPCRLCPHFSWERVRREVESLPELLRFGPGTSFLPVLDPMAPGRVVRLRRVNGVVPSGDPPNASVPRTPIPDAHATHDGRCTVCGATGEGLLAACGRTDLGRIGMLELE